MPTQIERKCVFSSPFFRFLDVFLLCVGDGAQNGKTVKCCKSKPPHGAISHPKHHQSRTLGTNRRGRAWNSWNSWNPSRGREPLFIIYLFLARCGSGGNEARRLLELHQSHKHMSVTLEPSVVHVLGLKPWLFCRLGCDETKTRNAKNEPFLG